MEVFLYHNLLVNVIKRKWIQDKSVHLLNNNFLERIIIIINMFLVNFLVRWKV